jgi:DNA-binding NarL/FixJ family response regulator
VVEVAVTVGDLGWARDAANRLSATASTREAPMLAAASLACAGAVRLAEQQPSEALRALRQAWSAWTELQAPYEAARTRVLIGRACRALGDEDSAVLEFAAARWTLEQLGAVEDLARLDALRAPAATAPPDGLTLRELQVLRLVATGATNRAVADELFLSEKTVARHIANIFTKLGCSTRAAATAYAYRRSLV